MKKIFFILITVLLFISCDEDPIFGLERGWIWGNEEENESSHGELEIEVSTNILFGNFKIFEGFTTTGAAIIEKDVNGGDFFYETLLKGEYTLKWTRTHTVDYNEYISSVQFKHGNCTTVRLWTTLNTYESCW